MHVNICAPMCEDQRRASGVFLIRSLLYILEIGSLTVTIKVTIVVVKHID